MASDEDVFNVGDNVLLYTGQLCTIISYDEKTNSYKLRLYDNKENIDDFYVISTETMKKIPNDTINFLNSFKTPKFKKGDYIKYHDYENFVYSIIDKVMFDEQENSYCYRLDNGVVIYDESYLTKLED